MKPAHGKRSAVAFGHLVRPDAGVRLRVLLPELAVSAIVVTCQTITLAAGEGADCLTLLVPMAILHAVAQSVLYFITYLAGNGRVAAVGWFGYLISFYGLGITGYLLISSDVFGYVLALSLALDATLFLLTRLRGTFVLYLAELLALMVMIPRSMPALLANAVAVSGLLALYVMRSSATRMTVSFVAHQSDDAADVSHGFALYGQVAALAAAVAALCLAVSLASLPFWGRASGAGGQGGVLTASELGEDPESADLGAASAGEGLAEVTADAATGGQSAPDAPHSRMGSASLALLLVPAMLLLPLAVRLLVRWYERRSLKLERDGALSVARLYLACLKRLEAAGIVRDEAETPYAFLVRQMDELTGLTDAAGVDAHVWETLTEAYERARYAGLAPSESELKACWRLYDALPACIRAHLGWFRYLTEAFWHL